MIMIKPLVNETDSEELGTEEICDGEDDTADL
jgi:hypothetical protein